MKHLTTQQLIKAANQITDILHRLNLMHGRAGCNCRFIAVLPQPDQRFLYSRIQYLIIPKCMKLTVIIQLFLKFFHRPVHMHDPHAFSICIRIGAANQRMHKSIIHLCPIAFIKSSQLLQVFWFTIHQHPIHIKYYGFDHNLPSPFPC